MFCGADYKNYTSRYIIHFKILQLFFDIYLCEYIILEESFERRDQKADFFTFLWKFLMGRNELEGLPLKTVWWFEYNFFWFFIGTGFESKYSKVLAQLATTLQ